MQVDPELLVFLHSLQVSHPVSRDPNDLTAYIDRYDAISSALPGPDQPLNVTTGTFNLNVTACGEKTRIDARLYLPEGVAQPVLMAYFHGGGWVAGSLASHDALCRQLSVDLQVAIASIHVPQVSTGFLQPAEQALQALMTLLKARKKLAVHTGRLLVGGDGSGAHLGLQAAWRLARQNPGSVDAVLAITPLAKPDFNTASYIRCANSLTFSRDDAVRSWHSLLGGRWETFDERAVLLHSNQPMQRPPLVVVLAAEHDIAHDDAVALHDWLREAGARCEFYGAPGMVHDFARYQYASSAARRLLLDGLNAFAELAELRPPTLHGPASEMACIQSVPASLVCLMTMVLTACNSAPPAPAPRGEVPSAPMTSSELGQSDVNRMATLGMQGNLASLMLLADKLYRRNPAEWRKAGLNTTREAALARLKAAIDTNTPWPDLQGRRDIAALSLALGPDFKGDRVAAFIAASADMLVTAHGNKTSFYLTDPLDAQYIYNAARNIEIAVWLLASRKNAQGQPLLLSDEINERERNLSFEREFGKIIGRLDLLSSVLTEKYRRAVITYVQNLLGGTFLQFLPVR